MQRDDGTIVGPMGFPHLVELFATADGRLYGAKEAGRNCILGRRMERPEPLAEFAPDHPGKKQNKANAQKRDWQTRRKVFIQPGPESPAR